MSTSNAEAAEDARQAADDNLMEAIVRIRRYNREFKAVCADPNRFVNFNLWQQHFATEFVVYVNTAINTVRDHGCPGLYERILQCIELIRMFGLPNESATLQVEFGTRKYMVEGNVAEEKKASKKLKKSK